MGVGVGGKTLLSTTCFPLRNQLMSSKHLFSIILATTGVLAQDLQVDRILTLSTVVSCPHELVWSNFVLAGHELVDCILIIQEKLHPGVNVIKLFSSVADDEAQ